jgi:quercetin dioxygenase-like cupin family protein
MTRVMRVAGAAGIVVLLGAAVATGQIKRTVLQQKDLSIAGREVVTARADFPAGGSTGLHTHPGDEISYVAEGTVEIVIEGASTTYKAGEAFHVLAGKVHDAKAVGGPAVVVANYVIEKGKPATTPVK